MLTKSILLEDIEQSEYWLGVREDMDNPRITSLIGAWYKTLHGIVGGS
jgi:hypothetical protein